MAVFDIDDQVVFKRLGNVSHDDIVDLMNHPLVRRHLPLARGTFGLNDCRQFVEAKEKIWRDNGYGLWAIMIDGVFAGWGGLQPEGDDFDVGLVLHPRYWGTGQALLRKFIEHAFDDLGVESVITLLPMSRRHVGGLDRFGFRRDGDVVLDGETFMRYRLRAGDWGARRPRVRP